MPGGVIGYATCSPHLNETRFVVQDVLKKRDDVKLVDARPVVLDAEGAVLPELGEGPYVQLWPHVHGTDAMFFAYSKGKTRCLRSRPPREKLASCMSSGARTSFQIQRDVVYALLLREIASRFGKSRVGFLWVLLEPIAHPGDAAEGFA